jgi:hypothetical protein
VEREGLFSHSPISLLLLFLFILCLLFAPYQFDYVISSLFVYLYFTSFYYVTHFFLLFSHQEIKNVAEADATGQLIAIAVRMKAVRDARSILSDKFLVRVLSGKIRSGDKLFYSLPGCYPKVCMHAFSSSLHLFFSFAVYLTQNKISSHNNKN